MMAAGQVHSLCHEFHHRWVQATFTVVFESGAKGPRRFLLTEAHFEYPPPQADAALRVTPLTQSEPAPAGPVMFNFFGFGGNYASLLIAHE